MFKIQLANKILFIKKKKISYEPIQILNPILLFYRLIFFLFQKWYFIVKENSLS